MQLSVHGVRGGEREAPIDVQEVRVNAVVLLIDGGIEAVVSSFTRGIREVVAAFAVLTVVVKRFRELTVELAVDGEILRATNGERWVSFTDVRDCRLYDIFCVGVPPRNVCGIYDEDFLCFGTVADELLLNLRGFDFLLADLAIYHHCFLISFLARFLASDSIAQARILFYTCATPAILCYTGSSVACAERCVPR